MFYLFILESIGTSELILIGLVALIVFGPRKLPELARMLGKAMNEFRRTTDDFKETWAREVDFEGEEKKIQYELNALSTTENSVLENDTKLKNEINTPEIKEISQADFQANRSQREVEISPKVENAAAEKRDWL